MVDGEIGLRNRNDLRAWLNGKPNECAQIIATRVALRVLPLSGTAFAVPDQNVSPHQKTELIVTVFRANFIAWAVRRHPADEMKAAAAVAAEAAADASEAAAVATNANANANVADAAVFAARAAADAAFANANASASADAALAAANAFSAAATAFAHATVAAAAIWQSIEADARWLDANAANKQPDVLAHKLANAALWPNGETPGWIAREWHRLRGQRELLADGVDVWFPWYEHRLSGGEGGIAPDLTGKAGERLDVRIAIQPDEWWDRDPKDVNADIARWVEEARR